MAESDKNTGKQWKPEEVKKLKELAKGNTPTGVIGLKLKRTKSSIQNKASSLDISLRPTNQSPYNRKKSRK